MLFKKILAFFLFVLTLNHFPCQAMNEDDDRRTSMPQKAIQFVKDHKYAVTAGAVVMTSLAYWWLQQNSEEEQCLSYQNPYLNPRDATYDFTVRIVNRSIESFNETLSQMRGGWSTWSTTHYREGSDLQIEVSEGQGWQAAPLHICYESPASKAQGTLDFIYTLLEPAKNLTNQVLRIYIPPLARGSLFHPASESTEDIIICNE